MPEPANSDMHEQRARVCRSLEETEKLVAEQKRLMADDAKHHRPLTHRQIGQFAAGGAVAGAALMGAGVALAKLFLP